MSRNVPSWGWVLTVAQFEEEEEDPLEKKEIGGDTSKQNTSRLRIGVTMSQKKYAIFSKGEDEGA